MTTDWVQPCAGGPRWRTLDNDQIEIEGIGIPIADKTPPFSDIIFVDTVWSTWGDLIVPAAAKHGVSSRWVASIMVVETRGKNYAANSAGAGGLMALMPGAASIGLGRQATVEDIMDPATAIDAGAGFIAYVNGRNPGGLPAVAAAYNAGSAKCSATTRCKSTIDGSWTFDGTTATNSMGFVEDCSNGRGSAYSLRTVALNNAMVEMGLGGGSWMSAASNVLAMAAGAAFGYYAVRNMDVLLR